MSEDSLHQPHDKLFKSTFADPATAAGFLRWEIPTTLSAAIDWDQLRLEPGSFVDSHYRHSESDLLFSAPLGTTDCFLAGIDKAAFDRKVSTVSNAEIQNTAMTIAQQYRQEGRQEGRMVTLQENIIDALGLRFGEVPHGLREAIVAVHEESALRALLRTAIQAVSLEDFAHSL